MAWVEKLPSGKWRGGYRNPEGRKRYTDPRDRKTDAREAAAEEEVKARRQAAAQTGTLSARTTWGDWWDTISPDRTFEESDTARTERYIVEKYLRPQWGEMPLNRISNKDIKRWVDSGALKTRPGMSAAYARRIYGVFSASIKRALDDEVLNASPCVGIRLPTVRRRAKAFMTDEHLDAYRSKLRDDYRAVLAFGLETGLRPGELCGLHVNRVNLDTGWLDVVEVFVDKQKVIRPFPKDKDTRKVPLTSAAVEILRRALDGRDLRKGCGVPHTDGATCRSELAFRTVEGRPMTPNRLYQNVTRAAKLTGADVRSPYTARRGFGTWAAQNLDAYTLQQIMGHSTMEETEGYVQLTEAARGRLLAARGEVPGLTVVRGADRGRGAAPGAESSKSESDSVGRDEGENAV